MLMPANSFSFGVSEIMSKKIALVGHCGPDSSYLKSVVSSIERGEVKEELSFSAWATALFDQIAQQNLVNHDSILALRHLVEQDRVD